MGYGATSAVLQATTAWVLLFPLIFNVPAVKHEVGGGAKYIHHGVNEWLHPAQSLTIFVVSEVSAAKRLSILTCG